MLNAKQLEELRGLQQRCEEADDIQLKLNWDMLQSRQAEEKSDFLHYENGKLAGFVGIYGFGNKVELCGMVDPQFRRQGIFTRLFTSALNEIKGGSYRKLLLNAPADSDSAKGFLQKVPSEYSLTEYQMKWVEREIAEAGDLSLRPAVEADSELEVQLDIECFGFLEEEARHFNRRIKQEGSQQFYMIETDGVTVGKMRVDHTNEEAWIYGFAVLPEHQGKGIGRKALSTVIAKEQRNGYPVFLEVEAKNAHALRLYESCGFATFQAQDYYEYQL
jgi:ribosomal protein S18 acetylase RimI-like enzyme